MNRLLFSGLVALGSVSFLASSAQALVLADFVVPQTAVRGVPFPPGGLATAGVGTSTVSHANILGGWRDVSTRITGFINPKTRGYHTAIINSDPFDTEDRLDTALDVSTFGITTVIWDGSPLFSGDTASGDFATPAALALGGASGLDITAGGADRIDIIGLSDIVNAGNLRVGLWDKNGYFAVLTKNLLGGNVEYVYSFLYANFVLSNPLFDFTKIGAIGLQIDARITAHGGVNVAGLDASIDELRTNSKIPEPMTAGLGILSLGVLGALATRRRRQMI